MTRIRSLALAALVAAGALTWNSVARAGDDAPAAPSAAPAKTEPAVATKVETDAPKTPSPIISMMYWVGKQIAPNLECPCAAKPEGEAAWRAWYAGGKDVPLAGLRDTLVCQGWTADKTVAYFKEMAAKKADCKQGDCSESKCDKSKCSESKCDKSKCSDAASADAKDGCCKCKGERADGKPCCGGCKKDAAKPEEVPAAKP